MPPAVNDRARAERAHTCDALLAVGPAAPTLCEGWTAADLAAHLYIRDNEPGNSAGAFVPAFAGRLSARMAELKAGDYPDLVEKVRRGPSRWSPFSLPAVDAVANGSEFLIHGMDVRRPNDLPEPARDEEFQSWAWSELAKIVRLALRRPRVALALEWSGRPERVIRAGVGNRLVTVIGEPTELMLYAFGRRAAADVRLVGLDAAVADALR
jgi:uncharacterized protein (TIGR03085 family)